MRADHVTAARVLETIKAIQGDFTTADIAQRLDVTEYSVRTAVFWLLTRREIRPVGEVKRYSERRKGMYPVTVYREVATQAADFAGLYRAFGLAAV